jgi:hypothetical protein
MVLCGTRHPRNAPKPSPRCTVPGVTPAAAPAAAHPGRYDCVPHPSVTMLIAHPVVALRWPAPAEATVMRGGSVAGCGVGFAVIRRVGGLRPLFGMRRNTPAPAAVDGGRRRALTGRMMPPAGGKPLSVVVPP